MHLTKYWYLEESFNMMKRMGMRDMMKLCEVLEMKSYRKGAEIRKQFDDDHLIYFIKKGHVKIGKWENEEFVLKQVLGAGNIFGESRISTGEESEPFTAIAMSECLICYIEVDRMEAMIEAYPKLHSSILKLTGLKFRKIERRLEAVLYKDAETRIKDFIIDFVNENGSDTELGKVTKNIFSHSDIAKLTSTSRQTVNNTISALRRNGLIDYDRKQILLKKQTLEEVDSKVSQ